MKHLSLSLVGLLLLCLALPCAQGIRLGKGSTLLLHHHIHVEVAPIVKGDNGGEASLCRDKACLVSTMKKKASGPSRKSSKDWIPSIQEDYYGPRRHRPKHHKH
ncbi:hypothetical protein CDL15_Pgr021164 [Punica granatum]|uniref:Uncharacterized protein n=1 Tax=Punica granatum TaxID=22663 RepID=A0A218WK15_PUNGR|nr:hypothetical protein CDL15_Pgr021164 [Punica granatum]PKI64712.1 hypothetical protein CRG98_014928 [Punica granatum]